MRSLLDFPAVKVVIPAAGLGARFAALHLDIPKELLPLGGTPVIGHALAEAARAGFEAAIVVVSPAKPQLREFLAENRSPLPVEIVTQPQARGIGDAVLRSWQGEPIAVLLPDDVVLGTEYWTSLIELHGKDGAATLCVRSVPLEQTSRFGIADCDGDRVIGLVEKPPPGTSNSNLAIFGRYVVTAAVIAGLRDLPVEGELELTDGFAAAISAPPGVRAVRFDGEIYDCGTPAAYAASTARFSASTSAE
jgi:UTP--glucose-1-phosphate uridylyltransferase